MCTVYLFWNSEYLDLPKDSLEGDPLILLASVRGNLLTLLVVSYCTRVGGVGREGRGEGMAGLTERVNLNYFPHISVFKIYQMIQRTLVAWALHCRFDPLQRLDFSQLFCSLQFSCLVSP